MSTEHIPHQDYRSSFLEEGEEYHAKFAKQIYRRIIWDIEQASLLDLMKRRFADLRAVEAMDFACGSGRVLEVLARQVGKATGVDVSPSMLGVARRISPQAEVVCCDITRSAELDDRRFNLITSFRFLANAEPELREEAMTKLCRMLAPGGIMIVNNHRRSGSARWHVRRLQARLGRNKPNDLHGMSDEEVLDLVTRHGLRVVETRHSGVLPVLKDRRPLAPEFLIRMLERWGSQRPSLARFCSHKIYMLEAAAASGDSTAA